ncbi:MAG: hypothetical protein V1913_09950 [Fibrobacterota bacterium]
MTRFLKTLSLLLLLFTFTFASERADFFVVTDPNGLSLFDATKSPLAAADKAHFLPGSPLQVIDAEATLGSELDSALKFSLDGTIYYLAKAGKDAYVGSKSKNNFKAYKNCPLLNDTIRVTRACLTITAPAVGKVALTQNDILVRIFSAAGQTYVKRTGPSPCYGLCMLPANAFEPVKTVSTVPAQATVTAGELQSIMERLRAANESYRAFFSHFSRLTGQDRSIPAWAWEQQEGRVRCTLKGPRAYAEQLKESTQYIVRDLENIFIGKTVDVLLQGGKITISPRAAGKQP